MPSQIPPPPPLPTTRTTRSQDASTHPKMAFQPRPRLSRFHTTDVSSENSTSHRTSSDVENVEEGSSRHVADRHPPNTKLSYESESKADPMASSPVRSRRRSAAAGGPKILTPFGDSHNRRAGSLRRARTSTNDKPRKRRSLDKPQEALNLVPPQTVQTQRAKPRASAPSRIPAPARQNTALQAVAVKTPERPPGDEDNLVTSQERSLKKLSLGGKESSRRVKDYSPALSTPDISPEATNAVGMMEPPSFCRNSSDLLESLYDTSPEFVAKPQSLQFGEEPKRSSTFQRQVSHAHALFGGPAIFSPTADEVPPSSSQPIQCDDDDDSFFKIVSPVKQPAINEPGILKKFKPRDSGVCISDDSDDGSPSTWDLSFPTAGESKPGENSSSNPAGDSIVGGARSEQTALKVLFHSAAGSHEKTTNAGPKTPVKKVHSTRTFTSLPRFRATMAPSLPNKGRKSMPASRFDLQSMVQSAVEPEPMPQPSVSKIPSQPIKQRPTILTNFIRRVDSGLLSASSSASSLSAESTPTHYKFKDSRQPVNRRPQGSKRPSHPLHIVHGLVSNEDEEGRFSNQFQVLGELGHGQFGVVLKVHDRLRHQEYAVKKSQRYEGVRHRNRLREEVQALKTLTEKGGHANVLEYIDSWDEDDHLYIQTSLCPMGNLSTFLNEYGKHYDKLEEAYIWKILADVSDGLCFIHRNGFIHLDLKPANIFISDEGRLKIGDFGMASAWPRQVTGDFEREGDREYMAPEILRGVYSKAADVFSLGMVILEAAANIVVPDMGAPWHKLREEDFDDVHFDGMSGVLVHMIRSLMRTDPTKRLTMEQVCGGSIVSRAREWMNAKRAEAVERGQSVMLGSPLAEEKEGFVREILGVEGNMELGD
ncbi:kinase-like protein [Serendipita vermifera]|nr:kinase-like protein [Serendipita vermifera]